MELPKDFSSQWHRHRVFLSVSLPRIFSVEYLPDFIKVKSKRANYNRQKVINNLVQLKMIINWNLDPLVYKSFGILAPQGKCLAFFNILNQLFFYHSISYYSCLCLKCNIVLKTISSSLSYLDLCQTNHCEYSNVSLFQSAVWFCPHFRGNLSPVYSGQPTGSLTHRTGQEG